MPCASCFGAATLAIAKDKSYWYTYLFYCLFVASLLVHCQVSFNPTGIVAFYVVGLGRNPLVSATVRFPAQVIS